LPYSVSEDDLKNAFGKFGAVSSVKIIIDKATGRSKGFAFVEMDNSSEATQAIKSLNETDLNGRNIKVNEARPREEGAPRKSRF
ncbi:MAG TPA: RNA-binding protein, partial [Gammaproteobacteria bacterium]